MHFWGGLADAFNNNFKSATLKVIIANWRVLGFYDVVEFISHTEVDKHQHILPMIIASACEPSE